MPSFDESSPTEICRRLLLDVALTRRSANADEHVSALLSAVSGYPCAKVAPPVSDWLDELACLGDVSGRYDTVAYAGVWRALFALADDDVDVALAELAAIDETRIVLPANRQLFAVARYRIALRRGVIEIPPSAQPPAQGQAPADAADDDAASPLVLALRNLARAEAIAAVHPAEALGAFRALLDALPVDALGLRLWTLQRIVDADSTHRGPEGAELAALAAFTITPSTPRPAEEEEDASLGLVEKIGVWTLGVSVVAMVALVFYARCG